MDSINLQKLFYQLTPDFVMDGVESFMTRTTGEYLQLNSFENRVYSVRVENPPGAQLIVKFYRPGRWSENPMPCCFRGYRPMQPGCFRSQFGRSVASPERHWTGARSRAAKRHCSRSRAKNSRVH